MFQEVYPSARPVFVNTISDEDIEQKIREANRKELERELEEGSGIDNTNDNDINTSIENEIKEEIEEVMEEAIDEAIELAIKDNIEEELERIILDNNESVSGQLSPEKLEQEIGIIEHMIHDNKMIQIVNDIMSIDDTPNLEVNAENTVTFETNPVIIEERKNIKNIDGFDIGLNSLPAGSPVIEDIPLTSQILIIEDPAETFAESEELIETVQIPQKKVPISSIDFGLIQEV